MFIFKKIYCRIFQTGFRIALPFLPYREPEIINSCDDIGKVFYKEKTTSVLIVTDKGISSSGILTHIVDAIKNTGVKYTIYDDTQPNPSVDNVDTAYSLYVNNNCNCLVAIGGGSSMDCAKAVGAKVAYPKKTLDKMKGVMKILRSLPTLITVPTTAGTGSEVTPVSIITDTKNRHKYALMSFPLISHYALLDAKLTYTLPKHLTSTTGMDALVHAIEAYIGRSTTKETRRLCIEATKMIFKNIETAYFDPTNKDARENMLHASYKAGIAFSKSYVGYIHAISHSLGGAYGTAHGLANAVAAPYLLKAYGKSVHKKLHNLAIEIGISDKSESHLLGSEKFIKAFEDLNKKMQIPNIISGIKSEDIPQMAQYAEKEANPLYPVPVLMTKKELEHFYYLIGGLNEKD